MEGIEVSTNYTKLINNLDALKLYEFRNRLDEYISYINDKHITLIDSLYELTEYELEYKQQKTISTRIRFAGFPFYKTIEDFDFSYQPTLNKEKILDLVSLRFIENKENILFVGTPGVGKTHLATSIGIEAAKNNLLTYFINCNDLIGQLKKAHKENRLSDKLKALCKYKLLIIDEVGFLPLDEEASHLLFQLISKRYEKTSTIITTNKALSTWGEIFGDNVLANAILDRLIHHSHVVTINGRSYRTKDQINSLDGKKTPA